MTVYTPYAEEITGANLSGSDGDEDRTYTLSNEGKPIMMQIVVDQACLQPGVDFTFDDENEIITFKNKVWDNQTITIDYINY